MRHQIAVVFDEEAAVLSWDTVDLPLPTLEHLLESVCLNILCRNQIDVELWFHCLGSSGVTSKWSSLLIAKVIWPGSACHFFLPVPVSTRWYLCNLLSLLISFLYFRIERNVGQRREGILLLPTSTRHLWFSNIITACWLLLFRKMRLGTDYWISKPKVPVNLVTQYLTT